MRFKPRNRQHWRQWLTRNHNSQEEVWLVFRKKSAGTPNLSYNDAVEEGLCFGWIDGLKKSIDKEYYCFRFSPRKANSNWSVTNKKRVSHLLEAGLIEAPGLKTIEAAKANGKWDKPVSAPQQVTMHPEFNQALEANPAARGFFESLAPSYRREFNAWINAAKRQHTRDRRVTESIKLLLAGKRLGMK